MLTHANVLTPEECDRVAAEINSLDVYWLPRSAEPATFFTLGVSSYQDLADSDPGEPVYDYYRVARFSNAFLLQRFGWLLGRVRDALQAFLGAPAHFDPRLAAPGFHIFTAPALPRSGEASIHFDLQYQLIDWHDGLPAPDLSAPVSFTLPIRLPQGGGGLNGWDISYAEGLLAGVSGPKLAMRKPKTFFPYEPGVLAIHSGHALHQIAGVAEVLPDDQRISLQGHGVRRGDAWTLYW
jgi:hypothetical protein